MVAQLLAVREAAGERTSVAGSLDCAAFWSVAGQSWLHCVVMAILTPFTKGQDA